MNRYEKVQNKKNPKAILLLASILLIIFVMIGSTVAFLVTEAGELVNTFTPATTGSDIIDETFADNVKEDVRVTNTGDIPVYVRVRAVIYWKNSDGDIMAIPPQDGSYTVEYSKSQNWIQGVDGFYYYQKSVEAGCETEILIEKVEWTPPANGEELIVDIFAETIQATPDAAVLEAWGKSKGGSVTHASNGTLIIATSIN